MMIAVPGRGLMGCGNRVARFFRSWVRAGTRSLRWVARFKTAKFAFLKCQQLATGPESVVC